MSNSIRSEVKKHLVVWLITGVVTGAFSWGVWITLRVMDTPTRQETREIVENDSLYARDKKVIEMQMAALQKNTEAINQLRVDIAKLSKGETP